MVADDTYPSIVKVLAATDVPPEPDNADEDMPDMTKKVNITIRVKSFLATISPFGLQAHGGMNYDALYNMHRVASCKSQFHMTHAMQRSRLPSRANFNMYMVTWTHMDSAHVTCRMVTHGMHVWITANPKYM